MGEKSIFDGNEDCEKNVARDHVLTVSVEPR